MRGGSEEEGDGSPRPAAGPSGPCPLGHPHPCPLRELVCKPHTSQRLGSGEASLASDKRGRGRFNT